MLFYNIVFSLTQNFLQCLTAYYFMSIYFCILNMYAAFLHKAGNNDYVLVYVTALCIITFADKVCF